jgi:hypothetical protein
METTKAQFFNIWNDFFSEQVPLSELGNEMIDVMSAGHPATPRLHGGL